jgi:hypothetical protein
MDTSIGGVLASVSDFVLPVPGTGFGAGDYTLPVAVKSYCWSAVLLRLFKFGMTMFLGADLRSEVDFPRGARINGFVV